MWEVNDVITEAKSALAEPLKNYEVGTTEEQIKGWQKFCDEHYCCKECELNKDGDLTAVCFSHWSKMPYEREVNNGGN